MFLYKELIEISWSVSDKIFISLPWVVVCITLLPIAAATFKEIQSEYVLPDAEYEILKTIKGVSRIILPKSMTQRNDCPGIIVVP